MTLPGRGAQRALALTGLLLCGSGSAGAQPFEQAGVRAQGMAGAFVAVVDDASAVWWNPAGLAGGPFFNALLEHQQGEDPESTVNAFAVATPPLGFSYQRLRYPIEPEAFGENDREDHSGDTRPRRVVAHEAGLTLLHSVTSGFVVGSTLKFVRGLVDDLATNRVDLDLGVHYRVGSLRAGLTARNLAAPAFGRPGGGQVKRQRQVRGGLAWTAPDSTVVAADVDVTDPEGLTPGRRVAAGVERQWRQRLAARAGVRLRTSHGPDPWVAVGGSYAVKPGVWLDGFWGRGESQDARWGVSARITY